MSKYRSSSTESITAKDIFGCLGIIVVCLVIIWVLGGNFIVSVLNGGKSPQAITQGYIRDTIFAAEPRVNGTTSIWMTHDDVGVYCTADKELGELAKKIVTDTHHSTEILLTYRSINAGDDEVSYFLNPSSGCGDHGENTVRYKILNILLLDSQ